jgi:predicted phosphate transport protein (TIGR00153 family)
MRLDGIIRWLLPKEDCFRVLLARDTQNLLHGTRIFEEISRVDTLEGRKLKCIQLKAVEHEGDQITRQIFEALSSSFITPLDREDIRSLAMDIDDVLDHLEGAAQYLVLFELEESQEALRQFAEILVSMAEQIDRVILQIWDIRHPKTVQETLVRVSELENQADSLYNTVIADLFKSDGRSPVEIMKWKVVYDGLEDACDECKDFTHILGNVVIKNA